MSSPNTASSLLQLQNNLRDLWRQLSSVERSGKSQEDQKKSKSDLQEKITDCERELLAQPLQVSESTSRLELDAILNHALNAVARPRALSSSSVSEPQVSLEKSADLSCNMPELKKLAANGNVDAQARLGLNYYLGYQTSKNKEEGEKWLSLAAQDLETEAGDWARARCYEFAIAQPKDFKLAFYYTKKAADAGYAPAQNTVGLYYQKGIGVSINDATAVNYFQLAARQGYAAACNNLGRCYEMSESKEDKAKAFAQYEIAKEQNFAPALCNVARFYMEGIGNITKYKEAAIKNYEEAAKYGFADAQCALGKYYLNVDNDPAKAITNLNLAAKQGNAEALYILGLYHDPKTSKSGIKKKFACFAKAAELDHPAAQYFIGKHYFANRNAASNRSRAPEEYVKRAFFYLKRLAKKGHRPSCVIVSECYMEGIGVEKNAQQAAKYKELAVKIGAQGGGLRVDSMPSTPTNLATSRLDETTSALKTAADSKEVKEEEKKKTQDDNGWVQLPENMVNEVDGLVISGSTTPSPSVESPRVTRRSSFSATIATAVTSLNSAVLGAPYTSESTSSVSSSADTSTITTSAFSAVNTSTGTGSRPPFLSIPALTSSEIIVEEESQLPWSYIKRNGKGDLACSMQELKERAADEDIEDANAKVQLGINYCFGIQTPKDKRQGADWLKAAMQHLHTPSRDLARAICYELGINNFPKNTAAAYQIAKAVASQGYAPAQATLTRYYADSIGVQQRKDVALKWYTDAANQGHAMAQFSLYQLQYDRNDAAMRRLESAAENGLAVAQRELAECYAEGKEGKNKDERKAAYYYICAANLHDKIAQNKLGLCYLHGRGVKSDPQKAIEHFVAAASQGNAEAINNLGKCYAAGNGVNKDEEKARSCFGIAAAHDYKAHDYKEAVEEEEPQEVALPLATAPQAPASKESKESKDEHKLPTEQGHEVGEQKLPEAAIPPAAASPPTHPTVGKQAHVEQGQQEAGEQKPPEVARPSLYPTSKLLLVLGGAVGLLLIIYLVYDRLYRAASPTLDNHIEGGEGGEVLENYMGKLLSNNSNFSFSKPGP